MDNIRIKQLAAWSAQVLGEKSINLQALSGDASFRRYYRFSYKNQSYIAVDAPPEYENSHSFQIVAQLLSTQSLNVPTIHQIDLQNGFMLLSDLGDTLFLSILNSKTSDELYLQAIDCLIKMQQLPINNCTELPVYNKAMLEDELALFESWFLDKHLQIKLSAEDHRILERAYDSLYTSALEQPQVFCHADYHSRNLMFCSDNSTGIIDFQDAVVGPVSFDLVSLLKDCYISWPRQKIEEWCEVYFNKATDQRIITADLQQFITWFDLMGLHRHLRILGIFSRLNYRDSKSAYLDDLPQTFKYVIDTCNRYEQFAPFAELLSSHGIVKRLLSN